MNPGEPAVPPGKVYTGTWSLERTVPADPANVSSLREEAASLARSAGADDREVCDVIIAVGEALANACRHGSPDPGHSKITLKCEVRGGRLEIEVRDEGLPFDPDSVPVPDPLEMRPHGMGIYLMRMTMDRVEFGSNCPGNVVRMFKQLSVEDNP